MKKCSRCREVKGLECFGEEKRAADGLRSECNECRKIESKKYREQNKEKIKEYREKNKERIDFTVRAWLSKNKDKVNAKRRIAYDANKIETNKKLRARRAVDPEAARNKEREYKKAHRERIRQANREWYSSHIEETREKKRARRLAYRAANPTKHKAHCIVNNALKQGLLERRPCSICGDTHRTHAHHEDYLKPLEVIWLCPVHHSERHNKGLG